MVGHSKGFVRDYFDYKKLIFLAGVSLILVEEMFKKFVMPKVYDKSKEPFVEIQCTLKSLWN